jgi:hypothetical protein
MRTTVSCEFSILGTSDEFDQELPRISGAPPPSDGAREISSIVEQIYDLKSDQSQISDFEISNRKSHVSNPKSQIWQSNPSHPMGAHVTAWQPRWVG